MNEIANPKMVACDNCGLLIGWSEQPTKMVCVPCFDNVRVLERKDEADKEQ